MVAVLDEIKRAEREAESLVESAKKEAERLVAEAKAEASEFSGAKEEELAGKKAGILAHHRKKVGEMRKGMTASGLGELSAVRKSAEGRLDEAVEVVLEAFEEMIEGG